LTDSSAKRQARDEKKQAYLRALFERHAERFRAAGDADAQAVARGAHAGIDDVLQRDRGRSGESGAIRCGKGCSHCCHGAVEIWPQEAALLVEAARAAGFDLDRERLERQSRHTVDTWQQQAAADRACVFLGSDGACRVYGSRPNACRKLLVMSDPALCDAAKHPPGSTERWFSWEAEMIEAAALETFGRALMPAALLSILDNRKDEG
jgi:Fe-S-cluster containining protein